ncbi:MAG: hypothetical protein KDB00_08590 [Planctomycetales bacterium]|nr:hypothetical protein [Planctomycetales bacterium]
MQIVRMTLLFGALVFTCRCVEAQTEKAADCFVIRVVDDVTGRGVPMVELKTVNDIRLYSDSAGVVAFSEPGLMDQTVYFHVSSHGYEFPKDGFGFRGKRLQIQPGGSATLRIKRTNIAQRIYRVTGAGIYRDSLLAGNPVPIKRPAINGQVLGSDSVVNTIYNGKVYWFWGDTNRPSYPLGNYDVPGAVSSLPSDGGLDPEVGVDLEYFVDEQGFAKPMAKMPGQGPTWITGLVTMDEPGGRQSMFASFVKIRPPLDVYERGLAKFDDETNQFQKDVAFNMNSPVYPDGHPFKHFDNGIEYVYFATPFPLARVRATPNDLRDLTRYESYTCLKEGSRDGSIEVERQNGKPVFGWKKNTIAYTPKLQAQLINSGQIEAEDGLFQLADENGKSVTMHGGSVYWNDYRKRWIMIGVQHFGTSLLGEVWYAESTELTGPWTNAKKIVTHEKYSFYNPKQHPMFDKDGGRVIFFEGTYTNTFSGNEDRTPRYNYNQIMYKLDLSDPRLRLP